MENSGFIVAKEYATLITEQILGIIAQEDFYNSMIELELFAKDIGVDFNLPDDFHNAFGNY